MSLETFATIINLVDEDQAIETNVQDKTAVYRGCTVDLGRHALASLVTQGYRGALEVSYLPLDQTTWISSNHSRSLCRLV
jgi:hypothetical protein